MSIKALRWAFQVCESVKGLNGSQRCVLMALAWHHTDNGCFPSQDLLGRAAGVNQRQARNIVKELEACGLITRNVRRTGGKFQRTDYKLFGRYQRQRSAGGTSGKTLPMVTSGNTVPGIGEDIYTSAGNSGNVVSLSQKKGER